MDNEKLVVVGTYANRIEAELAQGALEAADIEATVSADDAGGNQPALWVGGVKLLVRVEDLDRATSILNCEPDDLGI
jgi:hypothetical protein